MRNSKLSRLGALCAGALLLAAAGSAQSALMFTLDEDGTDLVMRGSGTFDLTGLTLFGTGSGGTAGLGVDQGFAVSATASFDFYAGALSGDSSFGSGSAGASADSGLGDFFGLVFSGFGSGVGALYTPSGYTSGDPLSGSARYDDTSFADLGIESGTYSWTLGNDTVTLEVPVPATFALVTIGALGLRRRRFRAA